MGVWFLSICLSETFRCGHARIPISSKEGNKAWTEIRCAPRRGEVGRDAAGKARGESRELRGAGVLHPCAHWSNGLSEPSPDRQNDVFQEERT